MSILNYAKLTKDVHLTREEDDNLYFSFYWGLFLWSK